jgi:hypothetical protein
MPVNTTAEARIAAGTPEAAVAIPVIAADVAQTKARLFTVDGAVAHLRAMPVLGESGGNLYLAPGDLAGDAWVVVEGRSALNDGDRVTAKEIPTPATPAPDAAPTQGGRRD